MRAIHGVSRRFIRNPYRYLPGKNHVPDLGHTSDDYRISFNGPHTCTTLRADPRGRACRAPPTGPAHPRTDPDLARSRGDAYRRDLTRPVVRPGGDADRYRANDSAPGADCHLPG